VHDYEVKIIAGGQEGKIKGHLEYGDQREGIPFPTRTVTWFSDDGGPFSARETIEFTGVRKCSAPASDFRLPAFGIQDIGEPEKTNSWAPIWLVVLGAILLVLALTIRHRRRKAA
jgi:hypothetical protein